MGIEMNTFMEVLLPYYVRSRVQQIHVSEISSLWGSYWLANLTTVRELEIAVYGSLYTKRLSAGYHVCKKIRRLMRQEYLLLH